MAPLRSSALANTGIRIRATLRQCRLGRGGLRRCQGRTVRRSIACKRYAAAETPAVEDMLEHRKEDSVDQESAEDRAAAAAAALLSRIAEKKQAEVTVEPDIVTAEVITTYDQKSSVADVGIEERAATAAANFLARLGNKFDIGSSHNASDYTDDSAISSNHSGRRVQFDDSAQVICEVTPYSEIYGIHPRDFVFGRNYCMLPAAPGGFVGLPETWRQGSDDEYDEDQDSSDDELLF